MDGPCDEYVERGVRMARDLLVLADEGDVNGNDDRCRILAGVVRDCAHKILREAQRERNAHRMSSTWSGGKGQ